MEKSLTNVYLTNVTSITTCNGDGGHFVIYEDSRKALITLMLVDETSMF